MSVTVTEEQKEARLDVCRSCSSLGDTLYLKCTECGCPIGLKATYSPNTCPLNKWPS